MMRDRHVAILLGAVFGAVLLGFFAMQARGQEDRRKEWKARPSEAKAFRALARDQGELEQARKQLEAAMKRHEEETRSVLEDARATHGWPATSNVSLEMRGEKGEELWFVELAPVATSATPAIKKP